MNLASVDLNLLLIFEALFQERSVTAAARRVGLGQPGMSAALSRLRGLLGDELFVRHAGQMRPTAKAVALAPGISLALAQLRRTLEAGIDFDPASSTRAFAIGGTDYTALLLLPPLIAAMQASAPTADIRAIGYEKGMVPEMLDRGEIDVALGVFPKPPGQAVVTPLFQERFVGLARIGHPAIANSCIDLQSFAALPHALVTTRQDATGSLDDALAAWGLERRIALTLPYVMVLPAVLEGSDLVAALPSRLADHLTAAGRLQRFALPIPTRPWTVSMLWLASARRDPAAAWLRSTITGCLATAGHIKTRPGCREPDPPSWHRGAG